MTNLLGKGDTNTKLRKNLAKGFETLGLSLAPHKLSGANVCAHASPGCIASCLFGSGMGGVFKSIPKARIEKTIAFRTDRKAFLVNLEKELSNAYAKAEANEKSLAVRLNVFSDIPWEKFEIIQKFQGIQFYDYTKNPNRVGDILPNYHTTFSRSEINESDCIRLLEQGKNVTVVFADASNPLVGNRSKYQTLPATWNGFEVIDGDESDLRFEDPRGVVVGLRLKAISHAIREKAVSSQFAVLN